MTRRRVVVRSLLGLVALGAWIAGLVVTVGPYPWIFLAWFLVPVSALAIGYVGLDGVFGAAWEWWRGLPSERELREDVLKARVAERDARIAELEAELFPGVLICWVCGKPIAGTGGTKYAIESWDQIRETLATGRRPRHLDCPPPKDPKLRPGAR